MKKLKSANPIFFDNTEKNNIIITPNSLNNLIRDYEEGKKYRIFFKSSSGIFLTVLLSLLTSDFKDVLGISKGGWQGTFVAMLVISGLTLLYYAYKTIKTPKFTRVDFINKLMQ